MCHNRLFNIDDENIVNKRKKTIILQLNFILLKMMQHNIIILNNIIRVKIEKIINILH